jgi:hypothetical protein
VDDEADLQPHDVSDGPDDPRPEQVTGQPASAAAPGRDLAEAELLDALEADLASVEEAMRSLDRIAAEAGSGDGGGEAAAAQIASVVSTRRFGVANPVAEVDLTDVTDAHPIQIQPEQQEHPHG